MRDVIGLINEIGMVSFCIANKKNVLFLGD